MSGCVLTGKDRFSSSPALMLFPAHKYVCVCVYVKELFSLPAVIGKLWMSMIECSGCINVGLGPYIGVCVLRLSIM